MGRYLKARMLEDILIHTFGQTGETVDPKRFSHFLMQSAMEIINLNSFEATQLQVIMSLIL